MLESGPLTRRLAGECGSALTWSLRTLVRTFAAYALAQLRKKRWGTKLFDSSIIHKKIKLTIIAQTALRANMANCLFYTNQNLVRRLRQNRSFELIDGLPFHICLESGLRMAFNSLRRALAVSE